MANAKHLEVLYDGVEHWNNWRRRDRNTRPDLSHATLKSSANSPDDPYDLYFGGANFRAANLRGANLINAVLCGSNFVQADLFDARISGSNLAGCNLAESLLLSATLVNCDLSRVDFSGAIFGNTIIVATDLSQSKNLAAAIHKFPSSISIDTLEKTISGLDDRRSATDDIVYFLEAAGVPQRYTNLVTNGIDRGRRAGLHLVRPDH